MIGEAPNLVRLLSSLSPFFPVSHSSLSCSPPYLPPSPPAPPAVTSILFPPSLTSCCLPHAGSALENRNHLLLVAPIFRYFFFYVPSFSLLFFFFGVKLALLRGDSLDSLGDYVSCYYSSRGTQRPRVPSGLPATPPHLGPASSVPTARSTLPRFLGYRFIDLRREMGASAVSAQLTKTKISSADIRRARGLTLVYYRTLITDAVKRITD